MSEETTPLTDVTVTLAVDQETIEEGFTLAEWVKRELGWVNDSGIYLVEIKDE